MRLFILAAAGSCTAEVQGGSSGSIQLNGYGSNQQHEWQINSDCESLHFKSSVVDINGTDYFYIEEEGSDQFFFYHYDGMSEYDGFNHTTNTGNVQVLFKTCISCSNLENNDHIFEVNWQCAESNESDVEPLSPWESWSESCSVTCGTGQQYRSRHDLSESEFRDCDKEQCVEEVDESEGTGESNEVVEEVVYIGSSGSISLAGYEDYQDNTWQINSDCEALLLESTKFNTNSKWDYLHLVEEGSSLRNISGDENFVQTTNTGTLTLKFRSDGESQFDDNTDGFEINWQCAESNESDEPICSHNGKQMKIWNDYNVWGDREGRRSEGGTEGGTEEKCKNLCLKNTECVAFLFKRRTKICELITGTEGIKYFYSDADSVSGIKCGHNPSTDILVLFMNLVVDEIYPESIVDEVDEVEKDDESNVRSDEELALTKAVCPSSDCWTLNEANSTCEIILSSDCFQLDCSFDRMTIKFDYGLFGGSSEAPQLNDFSPAISQFDVAENLPFMLDCEFDQCAISPEVVLAPRKLNLKTTITKSKNENDMIKLGDDVLVRNANGVSMVFLCVYETEIKLTDAKFNVKKAEVAGSVSERGDLDLGFTLEVMGSEYIGGTRSALITWKQGGKLSNINFLATDCTIEHGGKKISIIKETCISRGLYGQSGSQTDHKKIIEFNWMSFMLLEKETVTQQILVCKILICSAGADDCTPISDDACPGNDDGYDFQQFKIY